MPSPSAWADACDRSQERADRRRREPRRRLTVGDLFGALAAVLAIVAAGGIIGLLLVLVLR